MHFGKYHVQREVSLDNSGNIPIMDTMNELPEITEQDIRHSLIARATAYSAKAKTSFSAMGVAAVGDSKFLSRVQNANIGFNIKTYQKMVEWLDEAERRLQRDAA